MNFLLVMIAIVFAFVSVRLFALINRQKKIVGTYETRHIKGAARGHLGMFCSKTTVDRNRKKLYRANSKF